jgi:hypothetical protein
MEELGISCHRVWNQPSCRRSAVTVPKAPAHCAVGPRIGLPPRPMTGVAETPTRASLPSGNRALGVGELAVATGARDVRVVGAAR